VRHSSQRSMLSTAVRTVLTSSRSSSSISRCSATSGGIIMRSSSSSNYDQGNESSVGENSPKHEEDSKPHVMLRQSLADAVINGGENGSKTSSTKPRMCLAIAGGGSPSLSALTSTPNASRVLLEGVLCYDRRSFADFIGDHPAPSSDVVSSLSEGGEKKKKKFSFSSKTAAHLLSNAALHRSLQLSPTLAQMKSCVGVGCASALVSPSRPDKSSRAHVVIMDSEGGVVKVDLNMSSSGGSKEEDEDGGVSEGQRRCRGEEDDMVGSIVLASVLRSCCGTSDGSFAKVVDSICNREGDEVDLDDSAMTEGTAATNEGSLVRHAAESIINGESDAVVLVPGDGHTNNDFNFRAMRHAVLPPDPLIFPGSFNPPHIGHVSLANAAVKAMMRKRSQERKEQREQNGSINELLSSWGKLSSAESAVSDSDNNNAIASRARPVLSAPLSSFNDVSTHGSVWGAADHQDEETQPTVLFEMSLTNPDKPPMEAAEATRRVHLFGSCLDVAADDGNNDASADVNMPDDWGVLLTSAPLFVQKVGILGRYVAPSGASIPFLEEGRNGDGSMTSKSRRKMTFVIGTDTMVRIINPKYYGNSVDGMLTAVREMGDAGVHFVVGGRVEQGKEEGDEPRFITGEEELTSLPADVRDMFTIVQEEDFRLDISSTELRKRAAEAAS